MNKVKGLNYAKTFFAINHLLIPIALWSSSGFEIIKIRRLIMTCGNPYKHLVQNAFNSFIDAISYERKLSDDQMECMQFGICDYSPRKLEEVAFSHY